MSSVIRDVEIHGLVALLPRLRLDESGTAAFDLHLTACLLLNILNIVSSTADNLSSQIETTDGFKVDGYLLLGPFALYIISNCGRTTLEKAALLGRIRHAPLQVHGGGIYAHQQDSAIAAASAH